MYVGNSCVYIGNGHKMCLTRRGSQVRVLHRPPEIPRLVPPPPKTAMLAGLSEGKHARCRAKEAIKFLWATVGRELDPGTDELAFPAEYR